MRHPWPILLTLALLSSCATNTVRETTAASPPATYQNPLDVLVADPFIFRDGDTYYLYGTADEPGLVVWTSDNLVDWRRRGPVFLPSPQTWSQVDLWAPELFKHNGKYYLHFTARPKPLPPGHRVVLAEGDSPLGPFREKIAPWYDPARNVIDAHVFRDDDGKLYLYSVHIGSPAGPAFEIHAQRLDGALRPIGESVKCISPSEPWEGKSVNEGPFVLRQGDTYILTYSGNPYFDPNYAVGYATAKSPLGPWTKSKDGPVLRRTDRVSGPGHHCFIDSPDGREWFIAYHTHQNLDKPSHARQLAIDRVRFDFSGAGPAVVVTGPTVTPQAWPSGAPTPAYGGDDEFDAKQLDRGRWTILGEDPDRWSLADGRLTIRTGTGDVYQDRGDLRNLFLRRAPQRTDFDVVTRVTIDPRQEFEQASIYLWQDLNNYVKLAVVNVGGTTRLEFAAEADGKYAFELRDLDGLSPAAGLSLRIARSGDRYRFFARGDNDQSPWRELGERTAHLSGLHVALTATAPGSARQINAAFDFVRFVAPAK